jgi:ABC-2 type transport system ATP-binding protein
VEPTLHVEGPPAPAGAGFSRLRLTTTNPAELGEDLLRALASDGRLRVRALNRLHPSLEEVFLAATRRSWDTVDRKTA